MCTNETDIDRSRSKLYEYNQTIIIAFYVKDVSLITYGINTIKSVLHICEACPFRLLRFLVPFFQS